MNFMSEDDFKELKNKNEECKEYFTGRWEYYSKVIEILKSLNIKKVLEIGPGLETMVKECDIMIREEVEYFLDRPLKLSNNTFIHDATRIPWPIEDKSYDIVISLQVWEHLENKQIEAFKEIMRISKMAILSFPYKWNCPKDDEHYPSHHMIDDETISKWTLNIPPKTVIKIPRSGPKLTNGERIIYFWEF